MQPEQIPLSLYIHLPWCVRKCPYCDFNSHQAPADIPQTAYVQTLLKEFATQLPWVQERPIASIFFGGGTPSLFAADQLAILLNGIDQLSPLAADTEITLEANPGAIDESQFKGFRAAGINRISLGVQSFADEKLQALGRIHGSHDATRAFQVARDAGFSNINIDLMYGLPNQSIDDALADLHQAIALQPTHLSWYQLTLEPNTAFFHQPPTLPDEDLQSAIQEAGQALLQAQGFEQYEVSAYARDSQYCQHNLNYWTYADYLGIGAGAHSKITLSDAVYRFAQLKHPNDYLRYAGCGVQPLASKITESALLFEFMLNALRLKNGVTWEIFTDRTALSRATADAIWSAAMRKGLVQADRIAATTLGARYLNDLVAMFL